MTNTRLTVAIHVLCLLAHEAGGPPVSSDYIAGSVNTNPVVIRRLLSSLREAGVVHSQGGAAGGWSLVRPAEQISLLDVYRLVDAGPVLAMHHKQPNPRCPVGKWIQASIESHYRQAQLGLERELDKVTIAEVLASVMEKVR